MYFISIPGVTDGVAIPQPAGPQEKAQPAQQQSQPSTLRRNTGSPAPSTKSTTEGPQTYTGVVQQQTTPRELAYAALQSQTQPQPQTQPQATATSTLSRPGLSTSATPSWVLPKKATSPPHSPIQSFAHHAGGSPTHQHHTPQSLPQRSSPPYGAAVGAYGEPSGPGPSIHDPRGQGTASPPHGAGAPGYGAPYYGLPNQFAGMSVGDNDVQQGAHPHGGHQAPQGVGAHA